MTDNTGNVSSTLPTAYPAAQTATAPTVAQSQVPPVVDNSAELKQLKEQIDGMKEAAKKLEEENSQLKEQLTKIENEKLSVLANQVADLKVSRGLLEQEKRDAELEELKKLSAETLTALNTTLSAIPELKPAKLMQSTATPLATPAPNPTPAPSPEEQKQTEVKELRMKLFGHEEDPDEYYRKLRDSGELW